jgi:hypothetical protein
MRRMLLLGVVALATSSLTGCCCHRTWWNPCSMYNSCLGPQDDLCCGSPCGSCGSCGGSYGGSFGGCSSCGDSGGFAPAAPATTTPSTSYLGTLPPTYMGTLPAPTTSATPATLTFPAPNPQIPAPLPLPNQHPISQTSYQCNCRH